MLVSSNHGGSMKPGWTRVSGDSRFWEVKNLLEENSLEGLLFKPIWHEAGGESQRAWLKEEGGKLEQHTS